MYSQKTVKTLKPEWYLKLSQKEKMESQKLLIKTRNVMWNNKPPIIKSGTFLTSKKGGNSVTKGKKYAIQNHFCTLVTTIYDSNWNQFVTIKNDVGFTVKMNLNNFE